VLISTMISIPFHQHLLPIFCISVLSMLSIRCFLNFALIVPSSTLLYEPTPFSLTQTFSARILMVVLWLLLPTSCLLSGNFALSMLSIHRLHHSKLPIRLHTSPSVLVFSVFLVPTLLATLWCFVFIHHPSLLPLFPHSHLVYSFTPAAIPVFPILTPVIAL
jgi:hypothetical protein